MSDYDSNDRDAVQNPKIALFFQGESSKSASSLRRLMSILSGALGSLKKEVDCLEIERLACILHEVYTAKYRKYHNLDHLFSMQDAIDSPSLASLAVLFHDIVYLNIDKRIHPLIQNFLPEENFKGKYEYIVPASKNEDFALRSVNQVFGFSPGQVLTPSTGLNEYLSALVAMRMLPTVFTSWELISICACIEATIPFRTEIEGQSPSQRLATRLENLKAEFIPHGQTIGIDDLVEMTVDVANRDLRSFFSRDFSEFVSHTWDLILESTPLFRNPLYSVKQFRIAIQKVERFQSSLDPTKIQAIYKKKGVIVEKNQADRTLWARINLQNEVIYLRIQLVTAAILEAIAELSGGDAPLLLLIGKRPSDRGQGETPIETLLDYSIPEDNDGVNSTVDHLLKFGKTCPSGFIFMRSPLAAFIYQRLRETTFNEILKAARQMFEGHLDPKSVLNRVPRPLLGTIIDAVQEISWSRAESLETLKRNLGFADKKKSKKVA